jgi:hypothetical protein
MGADPTLIIQMQRMGDLVMSFPLMAWLLAVEPARPLWVLAEPHFFEALMPFAPRVVFFDPKAAPNLRATRFYRVINLSHRAQARQLAGALEAEKRYGSFSDKAGAHDIHIWGAWQLYRASIVHNNRHNRLHWADLAALDAVPPSCLPGTIWPRPRLPGAEGRVGLFVGASEEAKRPGASFWAELARHLIRRGCNPVFLGGPDDRPLAAEAARLADIPRSNLAGRFSLEKFAGFIQQLDLLVTPDTGPMHVGAWVQAPTLNLSMGPVNPWETAPAPPGHLVLRAEPSCAGCWRCHRQRPGDAPPCHAAFVPGRIAALIQAVLHGNAHKLETPNLRLWRTARDERGMFALLPADNKALRPRDLRGALWREAFLALLDGPPHRLPQAVRALRQTEPRSIARLARCAGALIRCLGKAVESDGTLWLSVPPLLRPLSGYVQMELENGGYSQEARERAMHLTRTLLAHLG